MKIEAEREYNAARNAERIAKQLETQYTSVQGVLEKTIKEKEGTDLKYAELKSQNDLLLKEAQDSTNAMAILKSQKAKAERALQEARQESNNEVVADLEKARKKVDLWVMVV